MESVLSFTEYVATRRQLIEERLKQYLNYDDPPVLWESMRYSVLSGGKRLRALLCLTSAESIRADALEIAMPCACAIELVHAMSLIHDDLPALDNDDLRRGRPTNHKVFGEAMSILAGDALLAMATSVLIDYTCSFVNADTLLKVASKLSHAIGANGMVGGQVIDISLTGLSQDKLKELDPQVLESMHRRKTGALITFSTWSGACLAGATLTQLSAFKRLGQVLGLAFQITDDLLDVTGDVYRLGKTPGKDATSGKITWVRFFGMEQSRKMLLKLKQEAREAISEAQLSKSATGLLDGLLVSFIDRVS